MPNNNRKNEKIVFLGDAATIVSEILKKYGLEETDEDILGKIEQGKPCLLGGIILDIVIEVAQNKILKKDLAPSIQKYLKIPKDKAKKIAEDVEKKLLILVKKVPEKEIKVPEKLPVTEKPLKIEKPLIIEKPKTPPKKQETYKEADVYREPIE